MLGMRWRSKVETFGDMGRQFLEMERSAKVEEKRL